MAKHERQVPGHAVGAARRPLSYWLSLALLAALALAIIGFFWISGFFAVKRSPKERPAADLPALDKRTVVVRDVVVQGRDEEGRPYWLKAVRSRRPEAHKEIVELEKVRGRLERAAAPSLTFRSDAATFHDDSKIADLKGRVVIVNPDKWTLKGPLVHVNTRTSTLYSDRPVTVYVNGGVIHARGIHADKNSRITRFPGPVHATFDAPLAESEEVPPTGAEQQARPNAEAPLTDEGN